MNAQQTYIKYLNKEITDSDFAYHMRRNPMLKEYISPISTVSDIISILKGKGVIWEEKSEETSRKEPFDAFKAFGQNVKIGKILEYADGDKGEYDNIEKSYGTPEIKKILEKYDNLGFDLPGEAMNTILTEKDWEDSYNAVEDFDPSDLSKIRSWREALVRKKKSKITEAKKKEPAAPKKPTKKKLTADDVNYYEFTMGWRYEYQNTPALKSAQNVEKAKEIAVKNLTKDPMYYSAMIYGDTFKKQAEDAKHNSKDILKQKSQKDMTQMKDLKNDMKQVKDQTVDKSNVKGGLKASFLAKGQPQKGKGKKLKESIKASVKKLLNSNPDYSKYIETKKKLKEEREKDLMSQANDLHKDLKKPVKEESAGSLKRGEVYLWTMGAEPLDVRYIGKRSELPNVKVGDSVGKGFIFQFVDEKLSFVEVGPKTVVEYIEKKDETGKDEPMKGRGKGKPIKADPSVFSMNEQEGKISPELMHKAGLDKVKTEDPVRDDAKEDTMMNDFLKRGGSVDGAIKLVVKNIKEFQKDPTKYKQTLDGYKKLLLTLYKKKGKNNEEFQDNTPPEYVSSEEGDQIELEKKSLKEDTRTENDKHWDKFIEDFTKVNKSLDDLYKLYIKKHGK